MLISFSQYLSNIEDNASNISTTFPNFAKLSSSLSILEHENKGFLTLDKNFSLFSQFQSFFNLAVQNIFKNQDVCLQPEQIGFTKGGTVGREYGINDNYSNIILSLISSTGQRFYIKVSIFSLRLALTVALGYDLKKIYRDSLLWKDFLTDVQSSPKLTTFETLLLPYLANSIGTFYPHWEAIGDDALNRSSLGFENSWRMSTFHSDRENFENDDLYYWEKRYCKLLDINFPLTFFFPTASFFTKHNRLVNFPKSTTSTNVNTNTTSPKSQRSYQNNNSVKESELVVEIARGEIDKTRWFELVPGDILTLDIQAQKLFKVLIDGKTRFLARPGVYHGSTAIQIEKITSEESPSK